MGFPAASISLLCFIFILLSPVKHVTAKYIEVQTAEQLVAAIQEFTMSNEAYYEIRLNKNISLSNSYNSSWPIKGLLNGTLVITAAPELKARGVKVYLDAAMKSGLTEPPRGAVFVVRDLEIMNICMERVMFNPQRNWSWFTGAGLFLFGRQR